jgi:haloalkane dehalogenase
MKRFMVGAHSLAYRDDGSGPCVVFVHGTPSSSAEFAAVIDALRPAFRCIAIDHLGFGESDKPADADYSIAAHRARLSALLDHLGVRRYHLVVHDFGGAIALPLALTSPGAVLSVTLMNTWLWPLAETEPALRRQRFVLRSPLMRWLYRYGNFSARVLVKAAWGTHRPLTRERHEQFQRAFRTAGERAGTIAFLDALVNDAELAWQTGADVRSLAAMPVLLIWGMADRMITSSTLRRWRHALPGATVVELPAVGHFVAEEAPELVVDALARFLGRPAESQKSA